MRKFLIAASLPLLLAGCVVPAVAPVAPTPAPAPAPVTTPAPAPTVLDAATRAAARTAVNREMAKRLPGVDTTPYTDCVINNATMAELADIALRARTDSAAAAGSVAAIVSRPAATQCIAKVAAAA